MNGKLVVRLNGGFIRFQNNFFQNQSGTLTFDWTFWIDLGWVVFLNSFPISDCQARMVVMHQSGCKIPTAENLDWHWLQLIFLCRSLTSVFDAICSSRAPVSCPKGLLGLILGPFWDPCWAQVGGKMDLFCMLMLRANQLSLVRVALHPLPGFLFWKEIFYY